MSWFIMGTYLAIAGFAGMLSICAMPDYKKKELMHFAFIYFYVVLGGAIMGAFAALSLWIK